MQRSDYPIQKPSLYASERSFIACGLAATGAAVPLAAGWLMDRKTPVRVSLWRFGAPAMVWISWLLGGGDLRALEVTGYSSTANDRFSSGYPTSPVENTDPAFVGLGLDWSGVGWASSLATKSFGMLSPQHYLVARHFGGASNITTFSDGSLWSANQQGVEDIGLGIVFDGQTLGDLSIGTLATAFPSAASLPRYAVLDLNTASGTNTTSAYNGVDVLLYGRGPNSSSSTRIGATSIGSVVISGNNHYFTTTRNEVQLQSGDSGSPAMHRWTNPDGGEEIALLGNHAAINDTTNFINFLGSYQVMNELNARMNDDGYALRVVGNPTNTWVGSSSTSIGDKGAWGLGPGPTQAPSDKFVTFDAGTAGTGGLVTVDANHNLRGLYFVSTGSTNQGFSFEGPSTLTLGRGGITNYDGSRQQFSASLALAAPQYWDGGSGGITAGSVDNQGWLLETTGTGVNRITGTISGTGGLSVSGGELELTGDNTYGGQTWVHEGTLRVNNAAGSGAGTGDMIVGADGRLAGSGFLTNASVTVSGIVAPGNSIGTLTMESALTWNAGQAWQFELGAAASDRASAGLGLSAQDLLDLRGVDGDFLKGTGSGWAFDFAGTGDNGWYRLVAWEAVTDFQSGDFLALNLADGKSGSFLVDGESSALYLQVIPEPASVFLLAGGIAAGGFRRRRQPASHSRERGLFR